jgi:hypothetical protein
MSIHNPVSNLYRSIVSVTNPDLMSIHNGDGGAQNPFMIGKVVHKLD